MVIQSLQMVIGMDLLVSILPTNQVRGLRQRHIESRHLAPVFVCRSEASIRVRSWHGALYRGVASHARRGSAVSSEVVSQEVGHRCQTTDKVVVSDKKGTDDADKEAGQQD